MHINDCTAQRVCDAAQLTEAARFESGEVWLEAQQRILLSNCVFAYKLTGLHSQRAYKTLVQCGVTCEHLTHTAHTSTTSRSEEEVG